MKNRLALLNRSMTARRAGQLIFCVYLLLPYVFFAIGINIFTTGLAPGDGAIFGVPTKVFTATPRLWNPYIQSGTFISKDIGWQSLYLPGMLVMRMFPNPFGYNLLLLLHYSGAGFFTFLFLKKLGLKDIACFIGGITFMFCGFFTAHKGHHSMVMTATYLPLLLYFIENLIVSGSVKWLTWATFAFGLSILADYTAVSMYIGMVSFPYILFRVMHGVEFRDRSIRQKLFHIVLYLLVIFIGGMMLAALEILPILESLKYVTRQQISFEIFTSYSFPLRLLPLLFFPYIYGATSFSFYTVPYFGPWNLTELAGYMGILPFLFIILCFLLFRNKDRQIYFWTGVFLFAFLLALGDSTPFYKLLYRVPVYNLFRAPARNWLEVNFAAAILSSFFIHHLVTDSTLQANNYYRIVRGVAVAFLGMLFSILAFRKSLAHSTENLQLWLQNTRLASPAIYVPLILSVFSVVLIYLSFQNRRNKKFWALIAIIIFIDLFSFGHFHDTAYLSFKIFQEQPNSVADFLNAANVDKKSYRILPLNMTDYENQLYPSTNLLYGFSVVNGYSPIWLKDYASLTRFGVDGTVDKNQVFLNSSTLSVLSTKYIIASDPEDKAFLQSIVADYGPDSDSVLVDDFNDPAWKFVWPERKRKGSIIIPVNGSVAVDMMLYSFTPIAKTVYKVTFSARTSRKKMADDILRIAFIGEDYDSSEQRAYISPSEVSSEFRKFTVYLYSGEQPPATAFLRFFTRSKSPYEIKDVQFVKPGGYAYWGSQSSTEVSFPLYQKKYESPEGIVVYENMNFLPRARFVNNVVTVPDADTAIYALRYDTALNPSDAALVEGLDVSQELDEGQVIDTDFSKDSAVTLSVKSGERSFLVLSDSWYPGWKAFVDGEETQIYRTNGVSRGIFVEGAGVHQVQFRFVPMSFYVGLGITTATMLTLVLMLYGAGLGHRKRATDHNNLNDMGMVQP